MNNLLGRAFIETFSQVSCISKSIEITAVCRYFYQEAVCLKPGWRVRHTWMYAIKIANYGCRYRRDSSFQ